jgi:UDP-glucose 4-epimerase
MSARILLTGGSSFTGVWIAEALAAAGFEVIAPLLRARDAYEGVRRERVLRLERCATVQFVRPFGSDAFLDGLSGVGRLDVLAHHAAHITGYRDPAYDALDGLRRNTEGAPAVLRAFRDVGGRAVVLTGSVFEAGEGGEADSPAVTPYGLSKTLTSSAFSYWAGDAGLRFARFVIPSPYGPLEEPRFGWYLFRTWFAGRVPVVKTPLYVRDHIAAPELAEAYVRCVRGVLDGPAQGLVARPSGWIATQGDFALRVAAEAGRRLGRDLPVELSAQAQFDEPRVRVNGDAALPSSVGDAAFWDGYVAWYEDLRARGALP